MLIPALNSGWIAPVLNLYNESGDVSAPVIPPRPFVRVFVFGVCRLGYAVPDCSFPT